MLATKLALLGVSLDQLSPIGSLSLGIGSVSGMPFRVHVSAVNLGRHRCDPVYFCIRDCDSSGCRTERFRGSQALSHAESAIDFIFGRPVVYSSKPSQLNPSSDTGSLDTIPSHNGAGSG